MRRERMVKKRKKYCRFCVQKIKDIDYKDVELLQNFITDRGKIRTRNSSGNCAKHQRKLARAIKNARIMALLPFVTEG
ncbi:MAG: 30S ribosomal protein S18 [Candidatus Omnitrophica bacterium 4484_49]|nr:MAG: 30S ribosomal protein S18 [Candidatus Omnitrophica bacterium 4484_49]HDM08722.1 30S ribosomal protein S18 [Candidatus Omnitrophota bacterium]